MMVLDENHARRQAIKAKRVAAPTGGSASSSQAGAYLRGVVTICRGRGATPESAQRDGALRRGEERAVRVPLFHHVERGLEFADLFALLAALDYFSVASRAVISQERQVLTAPDAPRLARPAVVADQGSEVLREASQPALERFRTDGAAGLSTPALARWLADEAAVGAVGATGGRSQ